MSKYSSSINNLLHIKQSETNTNIAISANRDNSRSNLDNSNIQAQFRVLDNIWTPLINVNTIEATYNCNVINIGSGNTTLQLNSRVGIGTKTPSVSLEVNTTDSIKLPKGNTNQRPQNLTSTDKGLIRYNTELDQFEGYGLSNTWGSIGGEIPKNYITDIRLDSSNFITPVQLNSSNFVNQTSLNSSNFITPVQLTSSNFVNQISLNSSNFITPVQLNSSNFVNQTSLNSSNFITSVQLTSSNFVNQTSLNSSNFIKETNINASTLEIDVTGKLNVKPSGSLYQGMTVQTKHLTYTQMDVKNNLGWDAINDDLNTGFVIAITPSNATSKILVNMIAHIGLVNAGDYRWWGLKLYRKIGTGGWSEITEANGTETGAAADARGTPVWVSQNAGMNDTFYSFTNHNVSGAFLDTPNTTQIVYYTAYWNSRIGQGESNPANSMYINRTHFQEDAYRSAPSSSWTATEIWNSGTTYTPPSTDGTITIASSSVAIGSTPNTTYKLNINQGTSSAITCFPLKISAGSYDNSGNGTATLIGLATENSGWVKCAIGHCRTNGGYDIGSIVFLCSSAIDNTNVSMANERMRITSSGNVGIGTNSPVYRFHIKTLDVTSGLHLDASDTTDPNKYALTIYPYVIASGQVGWIFRTQNLNGGTHNPLTLNNNGNITVAGSVTATSFNGSGASLTSLNASNITSGILSVERGGTGSATLANFITPVQLTSSNFVNQTSLSSSNFITPVQLNSSNFVNQISLNSSNFIKETDYLDWDNTNNRLGIGKTNPLTTLDVNGIITSTGLLCSGGAIVIDTSNNVNIDSGLLYINGINNNIGIGTTLPTKKLHVIGDTRIEGNLTVNGTLTQINTDVNTTEQLVITNDGTGPALIVNQIGAHPIIEFQDDGATCFKIFNGGDITIGSNTKNANLDIFGNLKISGTITGSVNTCNITGVLAVANGGTGATTLANFITPFQLNSSNFVNQTSLNSSNFITPFQLNSSNFVNQTSLNSCNFITPFQLNSSNFVNQTSLNSSNFITPVQLNSSNFVNQTSLNSSNFITPVQLSSSNFVNQTNLNSSNYLKGELQSNVYRFPYTSLIHPLFEIFETHPIINNSDILTTSIPNFKFLSRNNEKFLIFMSDESSDYTTFQINFGSGLTINKSLIIGGGGGGAGGITQNASGGGGGGGAAFTSENIILSGNYIIKIGKGGIGNNAGIGGNGKNTSIYNETSKLEVIGGGGGGYSSIGNNGGNGGGGGGSIYTGGSGINGSNIGVFSFSTFKSYNGNQGSSAGGGGGGAGGPSIGPSINGSDGYLSDILNNSIYTTGFYYSGGGGGTAYFNGNNMGGNGGNGGGGGGGSGFNNELWGGAGGTGINISNLNSIENITQINADKGSQNQNSVYPIEISGGHGLKGTGGGGGGATFNSKYGWDGYGGNGGSGIIIIKYVFSSGKPITNGYLEYDLTVSSWLVNAKPDFITLGDIPVQYSTTILESDLANKAGNLIDWNNTSKQFDLNIPAGTYAIPSEIIPQVQSDFNEVDTNSLAYIQNKPVVLDFINSIINESGVITITYEASQHWFKNTQNQYTFLITGSKKIRLYNNIIFNDLTEQSTASVKSDWDEVDTASLAYIENKPDLSSFITIGDIPIQYNTTILETDLANKAGNLIDWNDTTKQFDLNLNNTYYDFTIFSKTVLNQLVVINNNALQFGQSTRPPRITIYENYFPDVNIVEYTNTEYFTVRRRDSRYLLRIDNLYNTYLGGRITFNPFGTDTGLQFIDGSLQTTAPVQSDWNENNISSLGYINNKPDLSNFITLGDIPVQYSTTILESDLANKAGNLIDWNNTSKQFDVNIPVGTYTVANDLTNFITSIQLNSSNFVKQINLDSSNFVNQTSLNSSNFITPVQLTSSNFVKQLTLNSCNFSQWTTNGTKIYYNNGNVGIGTSDPAQKLHIVHTNNNLVRIEADTNAISQVSGIEFGIPGFASTTRSKVTSTTFSGDACDLQFYTSAATASSAVRMTINSAGSVGIGKTNPGTLLDVNGTITATSFYGSGASLTALSATNITTGTLGVANGGTGATTLALGQLLIGNTTSALIQSANLVWDNANSRLGISKATPGYPLDVTGDINITGNFRINGTIFTGSSSSQWITSSTNIYYNTGNVGIGTTTINERLTIVGTTARQMMITNTQAAAASYMGFSNSANDSLAYIGVDGSGLTNIVYGALTLGTWKDKPILFTTGATNTEKMRIENNGNVGIGIANPTNKLHIIHSSTATNADAVGGAGLYVFNPTNTTNHNSIICNRIAGSIANKVIYSMDVTGAYGWSMYIQGNDTANKLLRFHSEWDATGGTDRMVINGANGNVGIGTIDPLASVDILKATSVATTADLLNMRFDGNWGLKLQQNYSGAGNIQYTFIHKYNTVNYNSLTFKAGNVGIITTNPGYPLDVTGDINITGNFRINGTIFTGSSPSQWITSSTNIYYNTGNVGIGTTTTSSDDANATFALPDARLYVRGTATAGSTTDIVFRGGLEGNNNGKVKIWLANDASHSSYIQSEHISSGNTQLTFGTASGNVLPVERMRIDNAGNIGIGVTTLTQKLEVGGVLKISTNSAPTNDNLAVYIWNQLNVGPTIAGANFEVRTGGDNVRLRINSTGNVGIGNTAPIAPLTIGDNSIVGSDGYIAFGKNSGGGSSRNMRIGINANYDFVIGDMPTTSTWTESFKVSYAAPVNSLVINSSGYTTFKNIIYVGQPAESSTIFLGGGAAGDANYNFSVIETRNYTGTENTELLLFKGNDVSAERIRLRASIIAFDTYPGASSDRTAENIRMFINSAGNVGINTVSPAYKLDVNGSCRITGELIVANNKLVITGDAPTLYLRDNNNRTGMIHMNSDIMYFLNGNGTNSDTWAVKAPYNQWALTINMTTNTSTFGGSINAYGNVTAYFSDNRLKTYISDIKDPLKIITKLKGFYYTPNDIAKSYGFKNVKQEIGLSAQDVQNVLPELISLAPFDKDTDKDGNITSKSGENFLTMSYDRLAPVFVEAIKELNKEIVILKNENNELKEKYHNLLQDMILIKKTLNL